ncbi:MAG: hypothetical protein ACK56I_29365 [bacterium]
MQRDEQIGRIGSANGDGGVKADQSPLGFTALKPQQICGHALEDIVGDQHKRFAQLAGPHAQAAMLQPQFSGTGDVHPGPIGEATFKERLQAGMAGPSL